MKLKFKQQAFQTDAVKAVVDCFRGQPIEPGLQVCASTQAVRPGQHRGVARHGGRRLCATTTSPLPRRSFLENIQGVQRRQNLPISPELKKTSVCDVNLDVEMETGTGKTYCYIKTMFELNRRLRLEQVHRRGAEHRHPRRRAASRSRSRRSTSWRQYGKRARYFIYNSKQLHKLESFSSDAGINVMIINVQAFNARGKDARRIYRGAGRLPVAPAHRRDREEPAHPDPGRAAEDGGQATTVNR